MGNCDFCKSVRGFVLKAVFAIIVIILGWLVASTVVIAGTMEDEMLKPSAVVHTKQGMGSATAFKVDKYMGTFLITSLHVVKNSTDIKVTFWHETESHVAVIYSYDEKNDIAILVTPFKHTALATLGDDADVDTFDEAYCVGSPINSGLVATKGIIGDNNFLISTNGRRLYRSDCGTVFGNSGGGLFVQRGGHWVYVGTPDMMMSIPPRAFMDTGHPLPHLGLMTRIVEIRQHLRFYRIVPEYASP